MTFNLNFNPSVSRAALTCPGAPHGDVQLVQSSVNEKQKAVAHAPSPQSPPSSIQNNRYHSILLNVDRDVWENYIFSRLDERSRFELCSVSILFRKLATTYLDKIYPPIAQPYRVIDTGSGALPSINQWRVRQWTNELGPLVKGRLGCSTVVMRKGLTLNEQIDHARKLGITVNIYWNRILEQLGDTPVKETYAIFITNGPFVDSENKSYQSQCQQVRNVGCNLPTLQEYVALCTLTQSLFKTCLYPEKPLTYARTSTCIVPLEYYGGSSASNFAQGFPLIIGNSTLSSVDVAGDLSDRDSCVVGGQRRFLIGNIGSRV